MKYIFIVYLFDVLDANILLYNVHQMISFSELTQPTEKSGGESPSNSSLSRWFTWLGIGRFLIPGGWICARRAVSLTS